MKSSEIRAERLKATTTTTTEAPHLDPRARAAPGPAQATSRASVRVRRRRRRLPGYLKQTNSSDSRPSYPDSLRLASKYQLPRIKLQINSSAPDEAPQSSTPLEATTSSPVPKSLSRLIELQLQLNATNLLLEHKSRQAKSGSLMPPSTSVSRVIRFQEAATRAPSSSSTTSTSTTSTTRAPSTEADLFAAKSLEAPGDIGSNNIPSEQEELTTMTSTTTTTTTSTTKPRLGGKTNRSRRLKSQFESKFRPDRSNQIKLFHFKRKPDMNKLPFYKRPLNYTELGWTSDQIAEHQENLVALGMPIESAVSSESASQLLRRKRRGKNQFERLIADLHGGVSLESSESESRNELVPATKKKPDPEEELATKEPQQPAPTNRTQRRTKRLLASEPGWRPVSAASRLLQASSQGESLMLLPSGLLTPSGNQLVPFLAERSSDDQSRVLNQFFAWHPVRHFNGFESQASGLRKTFVPFDAQPETQESPQMRKQTNPIESNQKNQQPSQITSSGELRVPKLLVKPMRPAKYSLNGYIPKPSLGSQTGGSGLPNGNVSQLRTQQGGAQLRDTTRNANINKPRLQQASSTSQLSAGRDLVSSNFLDC